MLIQLTLQQAIYVLIEKQVFGYGVYRAGYHGCMYCFWICFECVYLMHTIYLGFLCTLVFLFYAVW